MARLVLLAALVVASSGALAQGITGSAVTGTVKDPEGTPVPEATVQLRNPATGQAFRAVTGPSGRYFIDNVPPGGPYELTATAPGYDTTTNEKGIQLALGQRLAIDVPLRYSGEAIEIVSHADSLDDHARTGASTTVKEETIAKLPLQGRNFTSLIAIDPRVTVTGTGVSIAGQNDRLNNIQIDGGANNDLFGLASNGTPGGQANAKPLSVEAIREFVVQVAPFDVRLGNFTGGLVNAITKSGTNEFHGSVFGYFQNKSLANKKAFITSGTPPATNYVVDPTFQDYTVWQFGGSVGGPIVKDKVHFFIATDIQQRKSAFGSRFNMIGDPTYDKANAGFDTTAVDRFTSILGKYGITNAGDYTAPSLSNPDRNVFVKVTTSAIENSNLELSYNFVNASLDQLIRNPTAPSIPNRLRDGYELSNSGWAQATTTHTVRGKLTSNFDGGKVSNELLVGASFIRDSRKLPNQAPLILVKTGTKLGAADTWLAAGGERFSQANALDQDIYQVQDNVSFTLDKHRFVVGTSNEFLRIRNLFLQAATGAWAFNSLNEFDAGTPAAFQRRLAVPGAPGDPGTVKFNAVQFGFYVQDEWSVLKNLTLSPGIRVDVPILSKADTNAAVLNSSTLPIDTGKVPSGNPLWSPRLGFNWDVDGSSDTIVRGGVGVFSGRPAYVWVSNAYGMNGLASGELTCTGAAVPAFSADPNAQPGACNGATGTSPPPGEIDYFDPRTRYPQNLRVALGADRRLPFGIVGSADFIYTRDINGWYVTDENLTVVGTNGEGRTLYGTFNPTTGVSSPTRIDPTNPNPYVKVSNKNGGYVTTTSLQLQKQFGQLYGVSVGYAYSRSFDRMSLTSSQALSNFQFAPIDGDIQNRSVRPSAFDRPHKVTITGTANLPLGFGVGLSYVGQSGLPYSWTVAGDVNGDSFSNDLVFVPADPSQISLKDPTQYAALDNFINSQDCLRKARGGIIKRGACRNPWQHFLDLRLTWTSPNLKGEQRIEFQWDIFNVLNLLNKNWGHFDQDAQFESGPPAFLSVAGYDTAANRPIYSFRAPTAPVTQTLYSPTQSRWRMQLGARYVF